MSDKPDPAGLAALSICEALLLALLDRNVLPQREIVGIVNDAAETHENAGGSEPERQVHATAAHLINGILQGGILARRT